jgi:hypothetical protein
LAAAGSGRILVIVSTLLLGACSTSQPSAVATPPSPSPAAQSPSPSPSPSSDEVSVPSQVLPPANDPPVGTLCSKPIVPAAGGNATPLLCRDGSVNVQAWKFYSDISQSILGLGQNPNEGQPQAAMCDDIAHNGATRSTEPSGYRLAAAYYGWTFTFDPAKVTCP